jgi:hypothetical protein
MKPRRSTGIKTLEQAREFVLRVKTCLIFGSQKSKLPSLWDVVTLPERQPGEKGWGRKITAIWTWKNQLPAECPDEIFYGKLPGGLAVLMSMAHLRDVHYPQHHKDVTQCSPLARKIFHLIRSEPLTTAELRKALPPTTTLTKSALDRALVELQVTLNIVRSNAPEVKNDTWLRFTDQYPEFKGIQDSG